MDPVSVVALLVAAGLAGALGVVVTRSRSRTSELESTRADDVAAAVDRELSRRQADLDARADHVRAGASAEAERTQGLAAQALASAEQVRAEAGDDVRRAEERRRAVEADVAAARAEIAVAREELARVREESQRREDRLAEREVRLDAELLSRTGGPPSTSRSTSWPPARRCWQRPRLGSRVSAQWPLSTWPG